MARNTSAWSIFLRGDNESFVATRHCPLTFLATEKVIVVLAKRRPASATERGGVALLGRYCRWPRTRRSAAAALGLLSKNVHTSTRKSAHTHTYTHTQYAAAIGTTTRAYPHGSTPPPPFRSLHLTAIIRCMLCVKPCSPHVRPSSVAEHLDTVCGAQ